MTKEQQNNKWWFKEAPKEYKEELIRIDRVTRVTAWGRQLRFRASVIIGNGNGTVWLGIWKAWEVVVAIEKAVRDAKKNLIKIKIINWTISHKISAKFKAASVMIHPASAWTWIIAGSSLRKVLSLSWIKDVLAKRYWSTNPITNARATLKALSLIKTDIPEFLISKKSQETVVPEDEIKKEILIEKKVENKKEPVKTNEIKKEKPVIKEVKKEIKTTKSDSWKKTKLK